MHYDGIMFSLMEICDLAVKIEKNGEKFYREAIEKTAQPNIKSLFQYLADEEVKHRELFVSIKEELKPGVDDTLSDDEESALLQEILGDQTFSLQEADLSKIEKTEDLIDLAVEFEKDTVLFFEMIREFIPRYDIIEKIEEFIEEEKNHIRRLREYGRGVQDVQ
jgi:rubrerythrin